MCEKSIRAGQLREEWVQCRLGSESVAVWQPLRQEALDFTIRRLNTAIDRQARTHTLPPPWEGSPKTSKSQTELCDDFSGLRKPLWHALWPQAVRKRRHEEELQRYSTHLCDRGSICTWLYSKIGLNVVDRVVGLMWRIKNLLLPFLFEWNDLSALCASCLQ